MAALALITGLTKTLGPHVGKVLAMMGAWDRVPQARRDQVTGWLKSFAASRSTAARIAIARQVAGELSSDANDSVEKEKASGYLNRASSCEQALNLSDGLRGVERRRARAKIRDDVAALLSEMIAHRLGPAIEQ